MKRNLVALCGVIVIVLSPVLNVNADPVYERVQLLQSSQIVQFMAVNDFDADGNLDIAIAGLLPPWDLQVAFGDGNGAFPDTLTVNHGDYDRLTSGFVNSDEFADVIALDWTTGLIGVYLSNGDRTFAAPIEVTTPEKYNESVMTGYINDDSFLDVVVVGNLDVWYSGDGTGSLTFEGTLFDGRYARGVALLDLNHDGINDAALIGQPWTWLFLGDGLGGFAPVDSTDAHIPYPSQYSLGRDVVDFDEDGNPDILVADWTAASQGDSKAQVIMTDGTGHIKDKLSIVVEGSLWGMTAFDFNDDGHLDIAAASTSERRLYIHLGDGTGGIMDSLSLSTDPIQITCLIAADFREDGVWDLAAGDVGTGSSVYIRTDMPPMSLLSGEMITTTSDDIGLRVLSPRSLTVDELRYHIPGARCDRRDADYDGVLDKRITDVNLQEGAYRISVWGTQAGQGGVPFSLTVEVSGESLVLARDATALALDDAVHFAIHVGAIGVSPRSGSLTGNTMPTFDWSAVTPEKNGATLYGIQISDSWDFSAPLYDVNDLTIAAFTTPAELAVETIYYWRYRTWDGSAWDDYSDLHSVTISSCNCPYQMDYDADGFLTVLDLMNEIDMLFAGKHDIQDPWCPRQRMDFDADGFETAYDLGLLIDHLFDGGPGPCDPCNPVQGSCAP